MALIFIMGNMHGETSLYFPKMQRNAKATSLNQQLNDKFRFLSDESIQDLGQYLCEEPADGVGDDPILLVEFLPALGNMNGAAGFDANRAAVIAALVGNGALDVGGQSRGCVMLVYLEMCTGRSTWEMLLLPDWD
jgi:hypothetical protein